MDGIATGKSLGSIDNSLRRAKRDIHKNRKLREAVAARDCRGSGASDGRCPPTRPNVSSRRVTTQQIAAWKSIDKSYRTGRGGPRLNVADCNIPFSLLK